MVRGKDGYSLSDKQLQKIATDMGLTLTKANMRFIPRDSHQAAVNAIDALASRLMYEKV